MCSANLKTPPLYVRVAAITRETELINAYCFEALDGSDLPEFTAGSHIGIVMPGKITRYYSICSSPHQRKHYIIAVQREETGRGGSMLVHKQVRVGSILKLISPRNFFELAADGNSLLLAGGIGITPMMSMAATLERLNRQYHLVYCTRGKTAMPFRAHLERLANSGRATLIDTTTGRADLDGIIGHQSHDTHVYFCGSERFNEGVQAACSHWERDRVHWESFNPASPAGGNVFVVEAKRSKKIIQRLCGPIAFVGFERKPYTYRVSL
jgi:vanillate O-demethylase ferredoxin subunit